MRLRQLTLDQFIKPSENAHAYPAMPGAMKVCCICHSADPEDSDINAWLESLETTDIAAFRNGMSTMLKLANAGTRFEHHYDEKKCHPTHRFKHNGQEHVVWRVRNGDLRLLFYYGRGKIVLLVDSFPKRSNKLTAAQKLHAESQIKSYVDAEEVLIL